MFNKYGKDPNFIITNKHVANGCDSISLDIDDDINGNPLTHSFPISFPLKNKPDILLNHHDNTVDLKNIKKQIFYITLNEVDIPNDHMLNHLFANEEVKTIDHPSSVNDDLYDQFNNLPITRFGNTALHSFIDYKNKSISIVDMGCFGCSSIVILNENMYHTPTTSIHGSSGFMLLGVLSSGPQYLNSGNSSIGGNITETRFLKLINLEFYVKSKEILRFKDLI